MGFYCELQYIVLLCNYKREAVTLQITVCICCIYPVNHKKQNFLEKNLNNFDFLETAKLSTCKFIIFHSG